MGLQLHILGAQQGLEISHVIDSGFVLAASRLRHSCVHIRVSINLHMHLTRHMTCMCTYNYMYDAHVHISM